MSDSNAVRLAKLAEGLAKISEQLYQISEDLLPASAETPAAPKTEAKPLKLEDVRAVLTTLSSSKGASAVKALLKDFGAEKLSDIAAQDYAELLAKAQEMSQ